MNQQRAALAVIGLAIPLAMVATLYTGGVRQDAAGPEGRIKVVTSFFPLYDFASHVAGGRAEVSSLIPPGVEPHEWEPTLGDVTRVRSADVLIINGAGFEGWANSIGAKKIINTSSGIELAPEGAGQPVNPHIWLDPVLAKKQVENIRAALDSADPANAQQYNKNAAEYTAGLDGLDGYIRAQLSNCEKSDFVSFHDAFGRFAERYGLRQHAIQGISPEGEVLPQRIEQAIKAAKDLGINVIYSEDMVDSRLADVIASELPGGKVLVLSPVEGVSKHELAAGIGYMDKMKENVANLREGLRCQ